MILKEFGFVAFFAGVKASPDNKGLYLLAVRRSA
jgi:hypothetical protein